MHAGQELAYEIIHGANGAWGDGRLFVNNALSDTPPSPEPGSLALLAIAIGPLLVIGRRPRRRPAA